MYCDIIFSPRTGISLLHCKWEKNPLVCVHLSMWFCVMMQHSEISWAHLAGLMLAICNPPADWYCTYPSLTLISMLDPLKCLFVKHGRVLALTFPSQPFPTCLPSPLICCPAPFFKLLITTFPSHSPLFLYIGIYLSLFLLFPSLFALIHAI